jgi:biopolymer transport protein ExbD
VLYTGVLAQLHLGPERILSTSIPGAPFVAGLIKPKLFLPCNFFENFSVQEQQWMLHHEFTHLQRRDLFAMFLCEWFRAIFWFNPLVHMAAYFIQHDQELACDQEVVSNCSKEERYQYGKALMNGSALQIQPAHISFFGSNYFGNPKERYIMLAKHKKSLPNSLLGLICVALIASVTLTAAPTSVAQQPVSADNGVVTVEPIILKISPTGEIKIGEETIVTGDLRSRIERAMDETPNVEIIIQVTAVDPDTLMTNSSLLEIMSATREAEVEQIRIIK